MFKKVVRRGRSKRGGEAYMKYVEPPSAARTKLVTFFNILLGVFGIGRQHDRRRDLVCNPMLFRFGPEPLQMVQRQPAV